MKHHLFSLFFLLLYLSASFIIHPASQTVVKLLVRLAQVTHIFQGVLPAGLPLLLLLLFSDDVHDVRSISDINIINVLLFLLYLGFNEC